MSISHGVEIALVPIITGTGILIAMAFTPADVTAITIAAAALVAALFTGIVNIITAWRTTRRVEESIAKVEENTVVTKETKAEVSVVAGHVNSAATAAVAKIEALQREIADTRLQMSELKQLAAMLAQSAAVAASSGSGHVVAAIPIASSVASPTAEVEHLKEIEKNTKETVITLTDAMESNTQDIIAKVDDEQTKQKGKR